jgi:hypothetical protein
VSDPSGISLFLQGTHSSPHFNIEKYTVGREGGRKYPASKGNALSRVDFALELRAHGKGPYLQVDEINYPPLLNRTPEVGDSWFHSVGQHQLRHLHSLSLPIFTTLKIRHKQELRRTRLCIIKSNIYPISPLLARSVLRALYMCICHIAHVVSDE